MDTVKTPNILLINSGSSCQELESIIFCECMNVCTNEMWS